MGNDWKENLANFFEELMIIMSSKKEALEQFDSFCEIVAEPAFEDLADELKQYRIKAKIKRSKGKSIAFQINFPKSRIDNFQFIILPVKDSIELKLKLKTRGRKNKKSVMEEREEAFMKDVETLDFMGLGKEDLIQDVIEHYRNFSFEAMTQAE